MPIDDIGGFLNSSDDLRVLWLALRSQEHATFAQSILLRESHVTSPAPLVGAAESDIRSGKPLLYVPTLRLPWATELKQQILKHVGVNVVSVIDGNCALRARDVLDVLTTMPCYGSRWDELVKSFYNPLRREYVDYNKIIIAHLNCFYVPCVLAKISNLVRLVYVNNLLLGLDKRIESLSEHTRSIRHNDGATCNLIDISSVVHSLNNSLPIPEEPTITPYSLLSGSLRRFFLVQAVPVNDSHRPLNYIVGGILVPAHLLNAVERSLINDYRLYIQVGHGPLSRYAHHTPGSLASLANHGTALLDYPPVCNVIAPLLEPMSSLSGDDTFDLSVPRVPPGTPSSRLSGSPSMLAYKSSSSPKSSAVLSSRQHREHYSVDMYLRNCFGVGWSSVCNAAIRNAKRQLREKQLRALSSALADAEEARSTGNALRQHIIDKAITYDITSSGLAGTCAIILARTMSDEKLSEIFGQVPAHVWRKIAKARARLHLLQQGEITSIDALTKG